MMETHSQSARIIPFPTTAQRQAKRFEDEVRRITEGRADAVADYEGGWYHADAIRDADTSTKQ